MNSPTIEQYPFFIIFILISNVLFAFIAYYILKLKINLLLSTKNRIELKQNKQESFRKLLDEHSDLLFGLDNDKSLDDWIKKFSTMKKDILLWGSDKVLREYAKYIEKYSTEQYEIKERELYFAQAILAFRKEIGYKNWFNRITPRQIVLIFRGGYKGNI